MDAFKVELRINKFPIILGPILTTFLIIYLPRKILSSPDFSRLSAIMQTILLLSILVFLDVFTCVLLFRHKICCDEYGLNQIMFRNVRIKWDDITKLLILDRGYKGNAYVVLSKDKAKISFDTRSYAHAKTAIEEILQRIPEEVIQKTKTY